MSSLPRPLTETDQANGALAAIGEPRIASLDDRKRKAARECKQYFADVRDALLRAEDWQFARRRIQLSTTLATVVGSAYSSRYQLPPDCLAVRALDGVADDRWETSSPADASAQHVLDANAVAPFVSYTRRVENPALWDPLFGEVFQLHLAAKVNPLVGRDKSLTAMLLQRAETALSKTARRDAQTRSSECVTTDTSWVRARGGFVRASRLGWR